MLSYENGFKWSYKSLNGGISFFRLLINVVVYRVIR